MSSLKPLDRRVYVSGQNVFSEGEEAYGLYIVQAGSIRIWKGTADQPVTLALIGPNGIFGEMAIIDQNKRSANATAVEDSVLIRIPGETVRDKLRSADPMIAALARILTRNLRATSEQVDQLIRAGRAGSKVAAAPDAGHTQRRTEPNDDVDTLSRSTGP